MTLADDKSSVYIGKDHSGHFEVKRAYTQGEAGDAEVEKAWRIANSLIQKEEWVPLILHAENICRIFFKLLVQAISDDTASTVT